MSSKVLSICVPVFNKFNFTKSCLDDLSKLSNDHEIIIIDNGSTDETKNQLEASKEITYFRNNINLGFGKACNLAYSLSAAPNVLFLNNDIRIRPGIYGDQTNWTQRLLPFCEHNLVGPTMGQLDDNFNFVREANQELDGNSYMSGWCLASSKKIWNALEISRHLPNSPSYDYTGVPHYVPQIFSEDFFCYFEDTDLSFRARKLGIPFVVVPVSAVHFGRVSSAQLNTHMLYKQAKQIFDKKWKSR